MFLKCFLPFCVIVLIIAIYFPARHAVHYEYIQDELILSELIAKKSTNTQPNLKACNYAELIVNSFEIDINDIYTDSKFHQPEAGGWHSPKECSAQYRIAIVIPYRNRTEQLVIFLNYMHKFLQNQLLDYRIIIVDQNDTLPFNRAKMLNYGAKVAMDMDYGCLILHDIDLIPLNLGNIYGCTRNPRHMSSSLDTFRFNLPYLTLFGGAISIRSDQFKSVNGFSNQFYGWGGEDDDFYKRLNFNEILPCRFSPRISKYIMLNHKREKPSKDRYTRLVNSEDRMGHDGILQLKNNYNISLEKLYTHVYAS